MFTPQLRVPVQKVITDSYQGVLPDVVSVQNWLNSRDHFDCQDFLDTIVGLNRVHCEPSVRMEIMNLIDSDIQEELDKLYKKTASAAFPINEEYQALSDTLQYLLLESSVAYQIIIHDIAAKEDYINQYIGSLIPEALFLALFYLSDLLVERFQLYLSEPVHIWEELNQLYLLAERIGAQDDKIRAHTSIKNKYLQISILKMLNPYRLMHLEARKIYHLLETWEGYCEIASYVEQTPENHFVVNLLADVPPHFYNEKNDSKKNESTDFEGRVLKMDRLRDYLDSYLEKVDQQKETHVFSYQSRMHNEMLQRIDNEIEMHEERSEERVFAGNEIKLVSGLRACHHFLNNRKPFKPQEEIDNQLAQKLEENQPNDDSGINLINLIEEERLLSRKNPMGELQSINPFMGETEIIGDEWEHIHATSVINANFNMTQKQLNASLKEESWRQRNESDHGMLLVSKNDIEMPIAVGMLVAFRLKVEKAYCLAVVKWLRVNPKKGMAIGLKVMAVQARALAVKGEEGAGSGGHFNRAFLISESKTNAKGDKMQLILPAGIYDKDSIIKVWHNKKVEQVRIIKILSATDSFEKVSFQVLH